KGSHVRLRHERPPAHTITVPLHNPLKTGTLHGILSEVAAIGLRYFANAEILPHQRTPSPMTISTTATTRAAARRANHRLTKPESEDETLLKLPLAPKFNQNYADLDSRF